MVNGLRAATDTFKEIILWYVGLLLVSALAFSWVEGVDFFKSLYWAGTTATSTGYGDISPKTPIGMVIAFCLMHLSIMVIAPLIIIRLMDHMHEDRNEFNHQEQEQLKADINEIKEILRVR